MARKKKSLTEGGRLEAGSSVMDKLMTYHEVMADGCWKWTRATNLGYGRINVGNGIIRQAHRVSYEEFIGPVPSGLVLDHLCRNRACINPAHLEPVTNKENIIRGTGFCAVNAAKTSCLRGHPLAGENVRISRNGERLCRTCARAYEAGRRMKKGTLIMNDFLITVDGIAKMTGVF